MIVATLGSDDTKITAREFLETWEAISLTYRFLDRPLTSNTLLAPGMSNGDLLTYKRRNSKIANGVYQLWLTVVLHFRKEEH
jgi:hypothetical protein